MNQISINPFALKRFFLLLAAIIGLGCLSSYAQPVLLHVSTTPYDRQMTRIRPILVADHAATNEVSLRLVNRWMGDLRSIPYGFTAVWKTPSETESGAPADCKAKAVDLYQRMKAFGATNLRLVIGRRTPSSRSTHAWLEWENNGETYLLDPTFNWMAYRSSDVSPRDYVPYYAFASGQKYRATSAALVAEN